MADRSTALLKVAAVRALEAAAADATLMERAGAAVARRAAAMALERAGPIVVLAGPGNNGGDALVAARLLRERGIDVRLAVLDAAPYRGDAAVAWSRWAATGGPRSTDPLPLLADAILVVDGLFGIGIGRPPAGLARAWIVAVNEADVPVLAIDVPSGVDADTGHVADVAIVAERTLTFLADKPGLHTGRAVDHVGTVEVDTLGVGRGVAPAFPAGTAGEINTPALFVRLFRPRSRDSHKGSNGSVAVVGGDHGMVGAALLASRMALHAGAGRVYVRLLATDAPGHDPLQPELMLRDSLVGIDAGAWAVGPGLGDRQPSIALLGEALDTAAELVLDADALNAIARDAELADRLVRRPARGRSTAVLTPHPLEAARLLGCDVDAVQRDRIAAATRLAARFSSVAVLKGAGTVVAAPDGRWVINPTGNPALGTGGTGDVLCGLVGGLLAQHLAPFEAACAAAWLHGTAADDLVAAGVGPVGLCASELIPAIRARINRR